MTAEAPAAVDVASHLRDLAGPAEPAVKLREMVQKLETKLEKLEVMKGDLVVEEGEDIQQNTFGVIEGIFFAKVLYSP